MVVLSAEVNLFISYFLGDSLPNSNEYPIAWSASRLMHCRLRSVELLMLFSVKVMMSVSYSKSSKSLDSGV